ncbi:MAG: hypothetical protein E6J45_06560 [Chloroflexi bacterium]|nr:MAG: hypothetical protein E6J45_06560 [Chloroflexota bacterium]
MNLATAAAVAPRPFVPRSADRSDGRFRRAIATCADDTRYRDVPVDWWDERWNVWRPTAVIRAGEMTASHRRHADVLVPDGAANTVHAVQIADLRMSRLLTAGVARYWTNRYRRLLLLALIEHGEIPDAHVTALHSVHDAIRAAEALSRDVWVTAFRTGDTPWSSFTVRASDGYVSDDVACHRAVRAPQCDGALRLAEAAAPLLALDVLRLHSALADAGVTEPTLSRHPLLAFAAGLLHSATAN